MIERKAVYYSKMPTHKEARRVEKSPFYKHHSKNWSRQEPLRGAKSPGLNWKGTGYLCGLRVFSHKVHISFKRE